MSNATHKIAQSLKWIKPTNRAFVERILEVVQTMEDIGGPDSYDDYIEVMQYVRADVEERIKNADEIRLSELAKIKRRFCFDGMENTSFEGIDLSLRGWNGWACPGFTREECFKMIDSPYLCDMKYDEARDVFVIQLDGAEEPEEYSPITIDGVKYYPIGAWGWTWSRYE